MRLLAGLCVSVGFDNAWCNYPAAQAGFEILIKFLAQTMRFLVAISNACPTLHFGLHFGLLT